MLDQLISYLPTCLLDFFGASVGGTSAEIVVVMVLMMVADIEDANLITLLLCHRIALKKRKENAPFWI
ncbi:hypothetical protein [uncultured Methanobrevibacter sp.]|uniref:hypothetical protein n=1 Tax=uncultured Methanobrevibacter sp. TaxID=253161 RepID=UPI0025E546D1|nr:hypothetical protein [uncultured Methanobrevibacter sp.]